MSPLLILSFCFFVNLIATSAENIFFATEPTCGETGKVCVPSESRCHNGRCKCWNPYTFGNGNFRCYKDDHRGCEIKNDPQLTTFDRETESFHFPCRYLASHVKPQLKDKNDNVVGWCEAKVYAFNARIKGKIFVLGFDVAMTLHYNSPSRSIQSSFRSYGVTVNNDNAIRHGGRVGQISPFVTDGRESITHINSPLGIRLGFTYDRETNRYIYTARGCGIQITQVPYDRELLLEQKQVPGLSITVNDANQPQWLSPDDVMCLVPKSQGGQSIRQIKYDNLSRERSMLLRAFKNQPEQLLPYDDDGQCARVGVLLNSCGEARQRQAIRNCDWMLKDTQFMKCYDDTPGSKHLMGLFRSCVGAWCNNRPCASTIQMIYDSGCDGIGKVEHLTGFLAGNNCPPR